MLTEVSAGSAATVASGLHLRFTPQAGALPTQFWRPPESLALTSDELGGVGDHISQTIEGLAAPAAQQQLDANRHRDDGAQGHCDARSPHSLARYRADCAGERARPDLCLAELILDHNGDPRLLFWPLAILLSQAA